MRKTILALAVSFVVMIFCFSAYAQNASKAPEAKESKDTVPVVIDEDVWVALVHEPAHHFHRAYEDFLNKELSASANEIRTASAFLKLETGRATQDGKKGLVASAAELDKLADNVENDEVASVKDLEQAFARAHYALAKHHYLEAKAAWGQKKTETTGKALRAASDHLQSAMVWASYAEEDLVDKVVTDTETVADKLVEGTQLAPEEVGKTLGNMGGALDKLAMAIEPAKK